MDTNRIKQLIIISQTKNLRRAAELLGITHAGLSKSVRALEVDLGVSLLTRDGRGIKLTNTAVKLLKDCEVFLEQEKVLISKFRSTSSIESKKVIVGTFEVFSTHLLPLIVNALGDDIQIEIRELLPGQIEDAVSSGDIDIGITYLPVPKQKLDFLEVNSISMGIYGIKALLNKHKNFEELPFVIPVSSVESTPNKAKGLDGWPDDRIHRNIMYRVSLMESALALARSGKAVAFIPHFIARLHNITALKEYQLVERKHKLGKDKQKIYIVKSQNKDEGVIIKKISKLLRSLE